MKTIGVIFFGVLVWGILGGGTAVAGEIVDVHLAVEFVDHAACAHIARNQGWYEETGLKVNAFDNYATGMALSAALAKGGIDAAYMCLFPAINAYANAGVGLKIVAGTHLYGYGLVVNPEKIDNIQDLSKADVKIGCTREGSPPAALLHKLVETYGLEESIPDRARRMPPSKLLLALISGQIDAAFMPEQFPTMAETAGFRQLISARELWPDMQGSVLVVTDKFLAAHPEAVGTLVALTARGVDYINAHPEAAAEIVAGELNVAGKEIFPVNITGSLQSLTVTPAVIETSLGTKMVNTSRIDPEVVQQAIDYAARLGYIRKAFPAEEILDLEYLNE
jgi:NitT/TauT family transport system substrate-binding protein